MVRRLFKIIIILIAALIIAAGLFALVVFGDIASYTATSVDVRSPTILIGEALVVYDPGLSGAAKDVASKIANLLTSNGYEVTFAGVRSSAAANMTGFSVIVVGGPIYAGQPTASIQGYLNGLNPSANAVVGVFGRGNGSADSNDTQVVASEVAPLPPDSSVKLKAVVKIGDKDNVDALCQQFVATLLH